MNGQSMTDSQWDYDSPCLHKGGSTYESITGTVCPCGRIRHRHSTLDLNEVKTIGGFTVLQSMIVPIR